jgi:hypothetical protein
MGPIDYSSAFGGQDPMQAFAGSFNLGAGIQDRRLAMQQQQLAMQQAQAKAQQEQAMRAELADVASNPTLDRIASLSVKYPQLSEGFKRSYDMLAPEAKQSKLNATIPIYAAALNGKPETSASLLEQQAEALTNSGREQEASQTLAFAEMFRTQPETAKQTAGLLLSSVMGPEKFVETFGKLGEERRAVENQPIAVRKAEADAVVAEAKAANAAQLASLEVTEKVWNIDDKRSTIEDRASRLSFDKDKALSDYQAKLTERGDALAKLPESAVKLVTDSTLAATVAEQSASSMETLATEFDKLGGGYGGFGTAAEAMAKLTGNQDAMTRARQEFLRLKNSAVVRSLPPGPATDRDIALFSKGFPDETADSKYLASFLRGMAKVQRREAVIETAKADWVEANGGLLRNKRDTEIAGVRVPAGAKFDAFVNKFAERKASEKAAEAAIGSIQSRPYMRWANQ